MFIFVILGAYIGSFVAAISLRVANEEKIFVSRSKCDQCSSVISFLYLIPIVGYFLSQGKCRNCYKKISFKYTVYEIIHTTMYAVNYYFLHIAPFTLFMLCVISSLLLMISIIDMEKMFIYDIHIAIFFILFTIFLFVIKQLHITMFSFIYAVIPFIFKYTYECVRQQITKKHITVIGVGDIKLLASLFFLLDFHKSMYIICLSGFIGLIFGIVKNKNRGFHYAFIPAISIAVYLTTIYFFI